MRRLTVYLVLLAGCAAPSSLDMPATVDSGTPLGMLEAWQVADQAARAWGGHVYWLRASETDPDPLVGDGVAATWSAEARDPTRPEALRLEIVGGGVLRATARELPGPAPLISTWNMTPPPGPDWVDQVSLLPAWKSFRSNVHTVDWQWLAPQGIRIERYTDAHTHPVETFSFDHAGWSTNGVEWIRIAGQAEAGSTFELPFLHPRIVFVGGQDIDVLHTVVVDPLGIHWTVGHQEALVVEAPAPGTWRVLGPAEGSTGRIDYCTPGALGEPHVEACERLGPGNGP